MARYAPMATTYARQHGTVVRVKRGCCVWPDGDDTHPSAAGSVGGSDDETATVFVTGGLEIM